MTSVRSTYGHQGLRQSKPLGSFQSILLLWSTTAARRQRLSGRTNSGPIRVLLWEDSHPVGARWVPHGRAQQQADPYFNLQLRPDRSSYSAGYDKGKSGKKTESSSAPHASVVRANPDKLNHKQEECKSNGSHPDFNKTGHGLDAPAAEQLDVKPASHVTT